MSTSSYRSLIVAYLHNKVCIFCLKERDENKKVNFNCMICGSNFHPSCYERYQRDGSECCSRELYFSKTECPYCLKQEGLKHFEDNELAHLTCKVNSKAILNEVRDGQSMPCFYCKKKTGYTVRCAHSSEKSRCSMYFHSKCHENMGLSMPLLLERLFDSDVTLYCTVHIEFVKLERVKQFKLIKARYLNEELEFDMERLSDIHCQTNQRPSSQTDRGIDNTLVQLIDDIEVKTKKKSPAFQLDSPSSSVRIEVVPLLPETDFKPTKIVLEEITGYFPNQLNPPKRDSRSRHPDLTTLDSLLKTRLNSLHFPEASIEQVLKSTKRKLAEDLSSFNRTAPQSIFETDASTEDFTALARSLQQSRMRLQEEVLARMNTQSKTTRS